MRLHHLSHFNPVVGDRARFGRSWRIAHADGAPVSTRRARRYTSCVTELVGTIERCNLLHIMLTGQYRSTGYMAKVSRLERSHRQEPMIALSGCVARRTFLALMVSAAVMPRLTSAQDIVTPEMFGAIGDGEADDTAAWQAALAASKNILGREGAIYYTTQSLGAPLDGATVNLNGSTILADWEQSTGDYEAVIFIDGQNNVTIKGGKIEYVGTFDFGASYGGLVSGIHANNADYLTVREIELTGFNRCGVLVGLLVSSPTGYCKSPRVIDCHCHHNRVAGVSFGSTEDGLVKGCQLHWTGHVDDNGTGYGFAGWSSGVPKNTTLIGNHSSDNYRKGLDFHSGHNGTIADNICARNRNDGIYVMGVTGDWTITDNLVDDMLWDNTFTNSSMYGIRVGDLGAHESRGAASFTIVRNTISNFRMTAGHAFPFMLGGQGLYRGDFNIKRNVLMLGKVHKILESTPRATYPGEYYDVAFEENQIVCEEAVELPFTIRGSNNRKKSFSHNEVKILAIGSTGGIYFYEVTSQPGKSLVAVDNDLTVPITAWIDMDPIRVRRLADEQMARNLINGSSLRDWDGAKFIGRGPSDQPPADGKLWTAGSIWWRANAATSESPGSVCVATGAPGKWQPL